MRLFKIPAMRFRVDGGLDLHSQSWTMHTLSCNLDMMSYDMEALASIDEVAMGSVSPISSPLPWSCVHASLVKCCTRFKLRSYTTPCPSTSPCTYTDLEVISNNMLCMLHAHSMPKAALENYTPVAR